MNIKKIYPNEKLDKNDYEKLQDKEAYLQKHAEIVHEGKKYYKCRTCGNALISPQLLKYHIESVHEGLRHKFHKGDKVVKKTFSCKECDTFFTNQKILNRHIMTVHEGFKKC